MEQLTGYHLNDTDVVLPVGSEVPARVLVSVLVLVCMYVVSHFRSHLLFACLHCALTLQVVHCIQVVHVR